MGVSVRQKTKGKGEPYWVFINHCGNRKSLKVGDLKAANKVASALREKLKKGEMNIQEGVKVIPTFKECADKWLAIITATQRASTTENYFLKLKSHILPVMGDRPIDSISKGDVKDFIISKLNQKFSASSLSLLKNVMSGVFNSAMDDDLISSNPTAHVMKSLKIKKVQTVKGDPFTSEEVSLFLDTTQKTYPEYHALFFTGFRTGMRLGEILGLQWGDIDFNGGFIQVQRSYRRGRYEPPKNGKARRVDMSEQLQTILRDHLTRAKKEALKSGSGEVPGLVFNRKGYVIEQNHIGGIFKKILGKAGLRHRRTHDMRHTFASLLLSAGESPVYVKDQLGHSSIQITVDIYGKWLPTEKKAGVNKLDLHLSAPQAHLKRLTT